MHLLTLNAAGKQLAAPLALDRRRRRLSQVVGRHVDRSRPFMLAVQRARDPLQPLDEAWIARGRDKAGKVRPWPRLYLPADAIVVVVYLPRGGGSGGRASGKGTALSIAALVAAVALVTFGGPTAIALLGPTFGPLALGGTVAGLTAMASLASRAKANKQATDTTQVYGVAGGGNLPRQGDRIPRGYGRSWMKPDLSQPDFSQYDGDEQVLFKRHTVGLGRYRPYALRAGKQTIWTEEGGFLPPFNDPRNAVEFIYGTPSTLVPSTVISAAGVGGLLPRLGENPAVAGPFLINQRGPLVSRLQVDFQFPQGISRTYTGSTTTLSNQAAEWSVVFQYAPIDESGAIVGPWADLYNSNSGLEGARFALHPLRYSKFKDVPPGRYAVWGWNVMPDTSEHTGRGIAAIDACQWDAASGWVADIVERPGVTELCLRIHATKATQAAAFGEIELDAGAIIPVWDGAAWSDQETSKAAWAFLDVMRNQDYGGALPASQLDIERARYYAATLTEFDTFDGTIRGPISVYEAAAMVLLPMRAEPVHLGRYWSLVRDEPKTVRRHLVSRRQILKGTTQLVFDLDTAAGAGHVVGEFDQDGDYRSPNQCTEIFGEASLTPTRTRWIGVRDWDHAVHLTRWRAASGAFRRQSAPFSVEMEGRIFKRGDGIAVDTWFLDARRVAGVVGRSGDTLTLDADIVLAAGDVLVLRDRAGREWGPVTIVGQGPSPRAIVMSSVSRAAVETATGLAIDAVLDDGRREATTALVGPVDIQTAGYLIQSVKPDGPDRAQVDALIDDPRVWEALDAPVVAPPPSGAGNADPVSPHVIDLTVRAFQAAAGLRLAYTIRAERGAASYELGLSYDGGNRYDPRPDVPVTGDVELHPVDPTTVKVRARAFGATGLPGPYFYADVPVGQARIADPLLDDLTTRLDGVDAHFAEVAATVAGLLAADLQIVADQTAQLAAAVAAMRGEVADLAEAAATVEGAAYQRMNLVKVALQGRTQDAFAAIKTEQQARISDVEALSYSSELVTARLGNAESAIQTEKTARETADSAQASDIATAYARLASAETGLSGLASGQLGLTQRVSANEGGIQVLSLNYTALNAQILAANGSIATQGTAIQQLQTDAVSTGNTVASHGSAILGLQNMVTDPSTGLAANANAFSTLSTSVTQQGNLLGSVAQATNILNSRVGTDQATVATVATSLNGVGIEYAITGTVNGDTGGIRLTGWKNWNGTGSFQVEISGDLILDGTLYGRAIRSGTIETLQLTTGRLILNGHVYDNAISTVKGAEGNSASVTYTYTNTRGQSTRLAIFAFFDATASGSFSNALQCGNLQIAINGTVYKNVNAATFVASSNAYLISQAICKQIDVGSGTFDITVQHTNIYGYGKCDVLMMEISK